MATTEQILETWVQYEREMNPNLTDEQVEQMKALRSPLVQAFVDAGLGGSYVKGEPIQYVNETTEIPNGLSQGTWVATFQAYSTVNISRELELGDRVRIINHQDFKLVVTAPEGFLFSDGLTEKVLNKNGVLTVVYYSQQVLDIEVETQKEVTQELKPCAQYATTEALPSCSYEFGVDGEGGKLTATSNGQLVVAGGWVEEGQLILVLFEGPFNGLYVVVYRGDSNYPWVLERHSSMNTKDKIKGATVIVRGPSDGQFGYAGIFQVFGNGPWDVGHDEIVFYKLNRPRLVSMVFNEDYEIPTVHTLMDAFIHESGDPHTYTLPEDSNGLGRVFHFKNVGTGVLTIVSDNLIDGATSKTLNQWESLTVLETPRQGLGVSHWTVM